jgi:hypothetical protein
MNRRTFLQSLLGAASLAVWPFGLSKAETGPKPGRFAAIGKESVQGTAVDVTQFFRAEQVGQRFIQHHKDRTQAHYSGGRIRAGDLVYLSDTGQVASWDHTSPIIGVAHHRAGPGEKVKIIVSG